MTGPAAQPIAPPVTGGAMIPVFRDKFAKGWPENPDGARATYTTIADAMSKRYDTDAHFCAYSVPDVTRRLATAEVWAELPSGAAMVLFVVDADGPEHAADDAWWLGEREKIARLLADHPGGYVFRTRGGYRLVYQLAEPIVLVSPRDAEQWKLRYVAWLDYLKATYAIRGDGGCKDWTRLYRLPHVKRDRERQERETIGDPRAIGAWHVAFEPAQLATPARAARKKSSAATSEPVGTLTHGERHPRLLKIAGAMRRAGADESAIVAALEIFNAQHCSPPKPTAELYDIARFVGGKAPAPDDGIPPPGDDDAPPPGDDDAPAGSGTPPPDDAPPSEPEWARGAATAAGSRDLPRIVVSSKIEIVVDQAHAALRGEGSVYQRGGTLVHIVRGDSPMKWLRVADGTPMIRKAEDDWLRERMSSSANWISAGKKGESDVQPPPWVPRTLRARGQWLFPTLDGCSDMPVLRPDGTIHDRPGYDVSARVFYAPSQHWPTIKSDPTQQDAHASLIELIEPFADFLFVAESDRYAAIAFILSIIARSAIDGPVPAFKFGATTPGSGKGLCADVGAIIATGLETAKMTHTTNEEETRKRALAIALSAPAVVMVDNIEGSFGGPTWAMVLTAGVITDRLLGASEERTVPVRSVIALTGNNVQFVGDTGRRVIPIDLDPKMEHPQDRTGFRHPDLKAYASANRVRFASAALTLLRAYFVAGQPVHGKPLYGSFDRWDRVVRSAIIWAGGSDVLEGVTRMRAEGQDSDAERLRVLTGAWFQAVKDKPVTCAELLSTTCAMYPELREAIDAFGIKGEPMTPRLLSRRLQLYRGRIVGGKRLDRVETLASGGAQRWQVVM